MTEEESLEAESLAYSLTIGEPSSFQPWIIKGYAIACERKRAEIERNEVTSASRGELLVAALKDLEAERARSAKLIDILRQVKWSCENDFGRAVLDLVDKAIAQYSRT